MKKSLLILIGAAILGVTAIAAPDDANTETETAEIGMGESFARAFGMGSEEATGGAPSDGSEGGGETTPGGGAPSSTGGTTASVGGITGSVVVGANAGIITGVQGINPPFTPYLK